MASTITLLAWGVEEYHNAYSRSGQLDEALDAVKWGTDYFLEAHVSEGGKTVEFYGQVGDGWQDHSYWGTPENMNMSRPSFKIDPQNPGSDLAAETAAALASAAVIFRSVNADYANKLLYNAKQLYEFADTYHGRYSHSISNAADFYHSSGYGDELAWGAAWLYKATGDTQYLNQAENYYSEYIDGLGVYAPNWDDKSYSTAVILAQETGKSKYRGHVENWLDHWVEGTGGIKHTSGGLAWAERWGSLRLSANTAFLAGVYSDTVNDYGDRYSNFANSQIDYILGDNPRNFSYQVGFGNNYPRKIHHRAAHGKNNIYDSGENQYVLYGALVGGLTSANDYDYRDVRYDHVSNEVALDYNAAFTGALARQYNMFGGNPLSDWELDQLSGINID